MGSFDAQELALSSGQWPPRSQRDLKKNNHRMIFNRSILTVEAFGAIRPGTTETADISRSSRDLKCRQPIMPIDA